jgi:predicted O-methyltransferase YrrM
VLPFSPEIVDWVAGLLPVPPQHIVDLGAGTGHGALALASRFPAARITAVDRSPVMVARLRDRFDAAGLHERTTIQQSHVDAAWGLAEPVDLVWASAVLHEVEDALGLLAAVLAALRPGGALVVVELDAPPRFLPHDLGLGEPGLEVRLHEALATASGRAMHPRWGSALQTSGFVDVSERRVAFEVEPPAPATASLVSAYLSRVRPALDDRLSASDLAVLDTLLSPDGPHALSRRPGPGVRASRTAWLGRRP